MKNIHLLPTTPNDETAKGIWIKETRDWCNIYITSDEEISEGDFSYTNQIEGNIVKIDKQTLAHKEQLELKKVILTTDPDLIKDGVQAIDDEFLEWFVKNPSCEEVEVELKTKQLVKPYDVYNEIVSFYKIIIPKEEPCDNCNNDVCCCIVKEETKQETLEEAAAEFAKNHSIYPTAQDDTEYGFIEGAKWQQQQNKNLYSDEDVLELLNEYDKHIQENFDMSKTILSPKQWFEQFKKK